MVQIKYKNRTFEDSFRAQGLRKGLVSEVAAKGISDSRILEIIGRIPRHFFFESSFIEFAYKDMAFPIGEGQTISQPFTVAFQTQLLDIKPKQKVLEVGTGSGYQTIMLMEMGANVFTIERVKKLYERTREFLPLMGYKPRFYYGDGYKGLKIFSPFDKIIVTAAAPSIPQELLQQLAEGGTMVIPVGEPNAVQTMKTIRKENGAFIETNHGAFKFVPMLEDKK